MKENEKRLSAAQAGDLVAKEFEKTGKTKMVWEIEMDSGEKILIDDAYKFENFVREKLISGELKLSNRFRNFHKAKRQQESPKEADWKIIRNHTDKIFDLEILYNPIKARVKEYGMQAAMLTWKIAGAIIAVWWNAIPFFNLDVSPILAIT